MSNKDNDKKVTWSEVGAGGGVGTLALLAVKYKVVDGGLAELLMFVTPFLSVASASIYAQAVQDFKNWRNSKRTNDKLNTLLEKCDTALADENLQPDARQHILSVRNKAQVVVIEGHLNELNEHLVAIAKQPDPLGVKVNKSDSAKLADGQTNN